MNEKEKNVLTRSQRYLFRWRSVLILGLCTLVLVVTLVYASREGIHSVYADASNDFNQGVSSSDSQQAVFWFQPSGWTAGYVILHYSQASASQQNVNMSYDDATTRWEYTAGAISAGQVITYSFTYQRDGLQYDTSSYTWTADGGNETPTPAVTPTVGGTTPTATSVEGTSGTFPLILQNTTNGTWANNQIYVLILGQSTPGQWSYLKPDGTLVHINHLDANAPNHLTKNGVNYANMSFTLADASTVIMPTQMQGARMYISLGSPMYIPIAADDSGWGGPNLSNPDDPNADVYFDWYEFTYQYGVSAFGGNTTQVDMFGFPMTARLQQTTSGYDQTVGITLSREQVYSQYTAAVSAPFQSLETPYRILAPHSSPTFQPGGSQADYLQSSIDQTWNYYASNPFTLTHQGETFTGGVVNGQLQFTLNGEGPFFLNKPTTNDVLSCSGALASGGMTSQELELGADLCAALNRGVALNTADWFDATTYYTYSVYNEYAAFWHQISLDHKAYGFAYDDVNSQSSVEILPNANAPSSLTINIGW